MEPQGAIAEMLFENGGRLRWTVGEEMEEKEEVEEEEVMEEEEVEE